MRLHSLAQKLKNQLTFSATWEIFFNRGLETDSHEVSAVSSESKIYFKSSCLAFNHKCLGYQRVGALLDL